MAISKAPSSQFVCTECGYAAPKWLGKCPGCGNFNTMQEELVKPAESAKRSSRPALSDMGGGTRAVPLSKVGYEKFKRISSGIGEFDTVLGGGIVRGSLVLLGGDPGIGKSTLLTPGFRASGAGSPRPLRVRRGELFAGKNAVRAAGSRLG